ncbi:related to Trehalose-phosphatase [Saccharomycodes ludwigii]|uniref:Related to Trehalose-phosphatase n=1 Tax=Saccharomycodes ludwigii TaxID=36035 RepID=A0A376B9L1_9ASCO|nr:hypothetical protein SCDLUD_001625 [Saccharomycodes ludwigii]KAH3901842.1 hypothetical protein SCDLUD_001625 [Saccharomycodes ludwigii]SSD61347.1 related to Trehalose-phosphatase [Saccharomycodes ludwigii]
MTGDTSKEKKFTGRIINCVTRLPYKITKVFDHSTKNAVNWKIEHVTGNSALHSSLSYIQENTDYEEIIVGWTGEISTEEQNPFVINTNTSNTTVNNKENESPEHGANLSNQKAVKDDAATSSNDTNRTVNEEEQDLNEALKLSATGDINLLANKDDPLYLTQEDKDYLTAEINCKYSSSGDNDKKKSKNTIHPVWLLRRDQERWRQYADNILWSDFHYILSPIQDSSSEKPWWFDYVKFNEAYAMKICQLYRPGDIILIHDYYLMLLPQILRMRLGTGDVKQKHVSIGYFHHVTFPSYEYFRCLPYRKQLLDGVLGADVLFFQNSGFARHFGSCCKRLLDATITKKADNKDDYNISAYGADILVKTMPIGIDKSTLIKDSFNENIDSKVETIRSAYADKKIIFGRDRLDNVRGVVQKLQAFDTFLEMYPEWRDKVVLIQVSSPSPMNDIKVEKQANELCSLINAKYGNLNFSPVQHYHMRIPKSVYISLLRAADLCVVASIRDSINTTALEFVTLQGHEAEKYGHSSSLILSEFSGTSSILKDSIIINPWDSVAVAKSINEALSTPNENSTAINLMHEVPEVGAWTEGLISTLAQFQNLKTSITPALNRPLLLQNYRQAKRRMFLFDYDGTLTPIVQDPAAAIPTVKLYNLLTKLADDPLNEIWIISGRDQAFLNKWFGSKVPQLGLSAEHGCFMKGANSTEWCNLAAKYDMSWQIRCNEIMENFTSKTPGSFVERKKVALTWHYRRCVPELGEFNARDLKNTLEKEFSKTGLEVMEGKMNVEVRPKFVNKGEIVKRLVLTPISKKEDVLEPSLEVSIEDSVKFKRDELPDFVLCLGDDFTDEDMFRQLNTIESEWSKISTFKKNRWGNYGFYPVTVGSAAKKTIAKAHLTDPKQVLDTLGLLVGAVSLFESAGSVDLDDRGHAKDSDSSKQSKLNSESYYQKILDSR